MRIISKYKDYYDYLVGIYGIDNKIVLDRREYTSDPLLSLAFPKITLLITGEVIEGYYDGEKVHYGESIRQFVADREILRFHPSTYYRAPDHIESVYVKSKDDHYGYGSWYALEPYRDKEDTNRKKDCPIIFKDIPHSVKYPILSKLDLGSFIPPEEMYKRLYEWLSNRVTEREDRRDIRTNREKVEGKGFDYKRSFRPNMKK